MQSYLESLLDSALADMILESASINLSSAIHLKQCKDKLLCDQKDNTRLSKSVFENFILQGSDLTTRKDEFKDSVIKVENKIH